MSFIAAMFLMYHLPYAPTEAEAAEAANEREDGEARAFWLLVAVMERDNGTNGPTLRTLYLPGMPGAREILATFDGLVARLLPKLARHMESQGVEPSMFGASWLLPVFTRCFPFEVGHRVPRITSRRPSHARPRAPRALICSS